VVDFDVGCFDREEFGIDLIGNDSQLGMSNQSGIGGWVSDFVRDGGEKITMLLGQQQRLRWLEKLTVSSMLRGKRTSTNAFEKVAGRPVVMLKPLSKQTRVQNT
jgi:hypothetical protein